MSSNKTPLEILAAIATIVGTILSIIGYKGCNKSEERPIVREERPTKVETQSFLGYSDKSNIKTAPIVEHRDNFQNENKHVFKSNSINSSSKDIAVFVYENDNNINKTISSSIERIYKTDGYNISHGSLISGINKYQALDFVQNNNNLILNHTDEVAIGNIVYSYSAGTLVEGTIICNIRLEMTILSLENNSSSTFSISANGNGVSNSQAYEEALSQLISKYNTNGQ